MMAAFVGISVLIALAALGTSLVALRETRASSRSVIAALTRAQSSMSSDIDWELQWIEPGVFFLVNTGPGHAALDVEVASSLTPTAGGPSAAVVARTPRVNSGAWIEVRHPLSPAIADDLTAFHLLQGAENERRRRPPSTVGGEGPALVETHQQRHALHDRVEFTLAYTVTWRTSGGEPRSRTPLEQRLVPSAAPL